MQFQQQMDLVKGQQQKQHFDLPMIDHKLTDFLRSNLDNLEGFCFPHFFTLYILDNNRQKHLVLSLDFLKILNETLWKN